MVPTDVLSSWLPPSQFCHNKPVGSSVYYSHDCSFIVFTYYGVHFQVAESSAVCLFRPFPDTCTVGYLYARFSDWPAPMSQMMPTVLIQVSAIGLVIPYHLVYSLMRDVFALQRQTARSLSGRPLLSNEQ